VPDLPNALWALDFQFDVTVDGRTLKILNVIDEFTREALAIEVDRSIDADGALIELGAFESRLKSNLTRCRRMPETQMDWY
jgi:hypothetical protein